MTYIRNLRQRTGVVCAILGLSLVLASCNMAQNQLTFDRSGNLKQEDYRSALSPRPMPEAADNSIPDLQSVVATPEDLKLPAPLVSVSVNQTVGLRDLLFELAEQAGVDLELDPQIRGSIIFTANERPFDQVVDRIAEMAGLRYVFEDNVLRMQVDRPYVKTYKMDYLNVLRSVNSDISLSVSVVSGEGADLGSGANISSTLENDFWQDVQDNVEQILLATDTYVSLATKTDPVSKAVMPTYQPPAADPNSPAPPPQIRPNTPPQINVTQASSEPPIPNPPSTFSISRHAGLITVFATDRQHKQIQEYLDKLRRNVSAQVLIEAKILEVSLEDEYASGINWENLRLGNIVDVNASFAQPAFLDPIAGDAFAATLSPGESVEAAINAISRFGTVRALSSPRLTVLNNQPAMLNVVENRVFFEIETEVEEDEDTGDETVNVDSEIRSVPEGILLSVVPSVDLKTGSISLALRPTVTSVVSEVEDPAVKLSLLSAGVPAGALGDVTNLIPQLSVQEMDSMVRMQSGQIIVMGGLMKDKNVVTDTGVPVLSSVPMFGNLFKSHQDRIEKTELIVFLKATLVPGSNVHETDRELYKKFGYDRRPSGM